MICNDCGETFMKPDVIRTTYESYYGVEGEFPNSTPCTLEVCPYCGSEDIDEEDEDEEEEDE